MTTINTEYILPQNQKLARIVNDLGELLQREDLQIYEQLILENFIFNKKLEPDEEKKFLSKLYLNIIGKLKELKFD